MYVNVSDKMMDYDPNFKLYFITRLPNPSFSPELQAKTTLIDFTVTQKGLEEQLLGKVISKEQKALEEQLTQVLEEVNGRTSVDGVTGLVIEPFVGRFHVGEHGISAGFRHLARIKDRSHDRLFVEGGIRMPDSAEPDTAPVLRLLDDGHDFRMVRQSRREGMNVQRSEPAAEVDLLLRHKLLVAEKDDEMINQRLVHRLESMTVHRPAQIDT